METTDCPQCHRHSFYDGVCSFCTPSGETQAMVSKISLQGWDGKVKPATGPSDQARIAAWKKEKEQADAERSPGGSFGWIISTVVTLAVLGGVGWLWATGKLQRDVPDPGEGPAKGSLASRLMAGTSPGGLPQQLVKPASPARESLALFGRELLEFQADAAKHFRARPDYGAAEVARYRDRLQVLKDAARKLEPQLTREETKVLFAFEHAERTLDTYLASLTSNTPDIEAMGADKALQQITAALAVARGEKAPDVGSALKSRAAQEKEAIDSLTAVIDGKGN